MANKCLLHKNKLEGFKAFLDSKGIPHWEGKGDYQVLQVYLDLFGCKVVYRRNHMPEHYTVDDRLVPLVYQYLGKEYDTKKED